VVTDRGPIVLVVLAFVVVLAACSWLRRSAIATALLDRPSERSLHARPIPRVGGIAVAAVVLLAAGLLLRSGDAQLGILVVGGAVLASIGLLDDWFSVSVGVRLAVQVAVACLVAFGGATGEPTVQSAVIVVAVVAAVNIYNFMDGIDGLAALQGIGGSVAYSILLADGSADLSVLAAVTGAACAGFLVHNFPPSRIFLGDAGSTFLGFVFAALGVAGVRHGAPVASVTLPFSPFILDALFTLARRALRREPIWRAHRGHLYQRAVQTGLGHRDVLFVYAVWALAAVLTAVVGSPSTTLAGWLASATTLVFVREWVTGRESKKARAAQPGHFVPNAFPEVDVAVDRERALDSGR
jgi:UDP-N-acetylmuramyl pentapeptide phosphotransferase/UDP-N-acetylglucosamine-1-phosphate transferase